MAFFLLGFVLTALVYAAAGSLVSRQEDVQQVALPMLMLSFAAYFAAFFASAGPMPPGSHRSPGCRSSART